MTYPMMLFPLVAASTGMKKWSHAIILLVCCLNLARVSSSFAYSVEDKQALVEAVKAKDWSTVITLSEKLLKTDPGDNEVFALRSLAARKLYKTDESVNSYAPFENSSPLPTPDPRRYGTFWDDGGVNGTSSISISVRQQIALFFKDETLVGLTQISTGREGFDTPKGEFKIVEKDKGDNDYIMRLTKRVSLRTGVLPGYRASKGDIRMPEFMAENFFKAVSIGTPVTITD